MREVDNNKLYAALNLKKIKHIENDCEGLVFRASVTSYWNSNTLTEKSSLRFLKSKSCNCCRGLLDDMSESVEPKDYANIEIPTLQHGKLYQLHCIKIGTYGEYDEIDYELEFVKKKESSND